MLKIGLLRVLSWIDPPEQRGAAARLDAPAERPAALSAQHLRRAVTAHTASGLSPAEAFRQVRLALNALEQSWDEAASSDHVASPPPLAQPPRLAPRSRAAVALLVAHARKHARQLAA